jgi:hypothetical protein
VGYARAATFNGESGNPAPRRDGELLCGNFASFEIVAEPGNGLCWATGGMEVGYGREEHCSVVVVLFSSEATLASFVAR